MTTCPVEYRQGSNFEEVRGHEARSAEPRLATITEKRKGGPLLPASALESSVNEGERKRGLLSDGWVRGRQARASPPGNSREQVPRIR